MVVNEHHYNKLTNKVLDVRATSNFMNTEEPLWKANWMLKNSFYYYYYTLDSISSVKFRFDLKITVNLPSLFLNELILRLLDLFIYFDNYLHKYFWNSLLRFAFKNNFMKSLRKKITSKFFFVEEWVASLLFGFMLTYKSLWTKLFTFRSDYF